MLLIPSDSYAFLVVVLAFYYSPIGWTQKSFPAGILRIHGLWNPPLVILLWISTIVDWTAGNRCTGKTINNGAISG